MSNERFERPLASEGYERAALELFSLTLLPGEYAARNAAAWACFSFDDYSFRNARLDIWIQQLGVILRSPGLLDQYQVQYLTTEEIAAQNKQAEENWS